MYKCRIKVKKTNMKRIVFLLLSLSLSVSFLMAQSKKSAPKAEFAVGVHDFGKIKESVGKVTCTFKFKNTGDQPLIIQRVQATCGCTSPSYTKEPVLPGKEGEVTVVYSATGNVGSFEKRLTVFTNVPDEVYILTIKGEVQLK